VATSSHDRHRVLLLLFSCSARTWASGIRGRRCRRLTRVRNKEDAQGQGQRQFNPPLELFHRPRRRLIVHAVRERPPSAATHPLVISLRGQDFTHATVCVPSSRSGRQQPRARVDRKRASRSRASCDIRRDRRAPLRGAGSDPLLRRVWASKAYRSARRGFRPSPGRTEKEPHGRCQESGLRSPDNGGDHVPRGWTDLCCACSYVSCNAAARGKFRHMAAQGQGAARPSGQRTGHHRDALAPMFGPTPTRRRLRQYGQRVIQTRRGAGRRVISRALRLLTSTAGRAADRGRGSAVAGVRRDRRRQMGKRRRWTRSS